MIFAHRVHPILFLVFAAISCGDNASLSTDAESPVFINGDLSQANGDCQVVSQIDGLSHNEAGLGTPKNPFLIKTSRQIWSLSNTPKDFNKSYKQCANINFSSLYSSGVQSFTIGGDSSSGQYFSGVYDGNNFSMTGFRYDTTASFNPANNPLVFADGSPRRSSHSKLGLFSEVLGEVRNLTLVDFEIDISPLSENEREIGLLAGSLSTGIIENIKFENAKPDDGAGNPSGFGIKSSRKIIESGALVGKVDNAIVRNISGALGGISSVKGVSIGGLIGFASGPSTIIENNDVKAGYINGSIVGGLLGEGVNGITLRNNLSLFSTIQLEGSGIIYGGGLVAKVSDSVISECESGGYITNLLESGSVTVRAGGLVGEASGGEISYSKTDPFMEINASDISSAIGGLIGLIEDGTQVSFSYAAGNGGQFSGKVNSQNVGGLIGAVVSFDSSSPVISISNSYSVVSIKGKEFSSGGRSFAGGFIGFVRALVPGIEIQNCYSASGRSGDSGGIEGLNSSSSPFYIGNFFGLAEVAQQGNLSLEASFSASNLITAFNNSGLEMGVREGDIVSGTGSFLENIYYNVSPSTCSPQIGTNCSSPSNISSLSALFSTNLFTSAQPWPTGPANGLSQWTIDGVNLPSILDAGYKVK